MSYTKDNFNEALDLVKGISVKLAGGYYEPKSSRDAWFSTKLLEVIKQAEFIRDNLTDIKEKHGRIQSPQFL
jgi:hypothetical protein